MPSSFSVRLPSTFCRVLIAKCILCKRKLSNCVFYTFVQRHFFQCCSTLLKWENSTWPHSHSSFKLKQWMSVIRKKESSEWMLQVFFPVSHSKLRWRVHSFLSVTLVDMNNSLAFNIECVCLCAIVFSQAMLLFNLLFVRFCYYRIRIEGNA